ncbi:hypothetical protein [Longivirga aurantiaca]|uniref:Uncharacterized protein n=1 Tax=Longivirga aurantiaca TaxID=1837743 RepID=A0ABW1T2R3_9ACTN
MTDQEPLTLAALKLQWIDVLYDLEANHRTAWLALFDGRLASLEDDVLVLDFVDATKMAGVHGYERGSKPSFLEAMSDSIERVTGRRITVTTTRDV